MNLPGSIAVGTDLVDVERLSRVLSRRPNLAVRVFTENELAYAHRWRNPVERLAARWAAKESVLKVLGVGVLAVPLREVEVVNSPAGVPSIRLHGNVAKMAQSRGISHWCLSLTHTERYAVAVVLGFFCELEELARGVAP